MPLSIFATGLFWTVSQRAKTWSGARVLPQYPRELFNLNPRLLQQTHQCTELDFPIERHDAAAAASSHDHMASSLSSSSEAELLERPHYLAAGKARH